MASCTGSFRRKKLLRMYDKACRKYDSRKTGICLTGTSDYAYRREMVPRTAYGEGIRVPFGTLSVPVPDDAEMCLTVMYGDWPHARRRNPSGCRSTRPGASTSETSIRRRDRGTPMNVTRWRNTDGGMKTQIGALLEAVFPHSYAGPEACAEADRLCAEEPHPDAGV